MRKFLLTYGVFLCAVVFATGCDVPDDSWLAELISSKPKETSGKNYGIRVLVITDGAEPLDFDQYRTRIDDEIHPVNHETTDNLGQLIRHTGKRIKDLSSGDYVVELMDEGMNCVIDGVNPRTVEVSKDTTKALPREDNFVDVYFQVDCYEYIGEIRVETRTEGVNINHDGYRYALNTLGVPSITGDIGLDETVIIEDATPGDYTAILSDIPDNCWTTYAGYENPFQFTLEMEGFQRVYYHLECFEGVPFGVVGGRVEGLLGDGLVLQNNGGDDLPISENGSFEFSQALNKDSPFNVRVSSQPTGQTCYVENGTGVISRGDFRGVVVTCSSLETYRVGGTVSGLTGTGLVLHNNGSDPLSITQNGPFTFPTELPDAAGYTVTVATQPTDQECTVTNGSGTISGADVTTVTVDCVEVCSEPLSINEANTPPVGNDGMLYTDFQLTLEPGSGGQGTVTWEISNGGLPPGMTLSTDGVLSGTPDVDNPPQGFHFWVSVTDECNPPDTAHFLITIDDPVTNNAIVDPYHASELYCHCATLLPDGRPMLVWHDGGADPDFIPTVSTVIADNANPTTQGEWQTHVIAYPEMFNAVAPSVTIHNNLPLVALSAGGVDEGLYIARPTSGVPTQTGDWNLIRMGWNVTTIGSHGCSLISVGTIAYAWEDGSLYYVQSTIPTPYDPDTDWNEAYDILEGQVGLGGPQHPHMIVYNGHPAVGWIDGFTQQPMIAVANSSAPEDYEDWTVSAVDGPVSGETYVGLAESNGMLAMSYSTGSYADATQALNVAMTSGTPTGPGDWDVVEVDPDEGGFSHMIDYKGRLVVAYCKNMGDDSTAGTSVKIARALNTSPTDPADWQIEEIALIVRGAYPQLVDLSENNPGGVLGIFYDYAYNGEIYFGRRVGTF